MGLFDRFKGKNSTESKHYRGVNNAEILLNSRFYYQYKNTFDYIYQLYGSQYDTSVFEMILWSLENGHTLEEQGFSLTESARLGLPYLCENEIELDKIRDIYNKLKQGEKIKNILNLSYIYGDYAPKNSKHPQKMKYWGNHLLQLINNGNIEAMAAVIGINREQSKVQYGAFFPDGVIDSIYDKYEGFIRNAANNGDYNALMYVAVYMTKSPITQEEYNNKIRMLKEATKGNTSDAWYWLQEATLSKIALAKLPRDTFGNCDITVTPEEEYEIRRLCGQYCLKGAEANNGCTAVTLQERVAGWYGFGDYSEYGIPEDYSKALYWYNVLKRNGINVDNTLEALDNYWKQKRG